MMSYVQRLYRGCRAVLGHPAARLAYAVVLAEDGTHGRAFHQFARAAHSGSAYVKVHHPSSGYAVVGVAAVLVVESGKITRAPESARL